MTLQSGDFASFFEAIHGVPPFPWQQRLVDTLLTERRWPRDLDLPTAAGKTAVIDAAVFVLAATADRPPAERFSGRRIFFVVDRRVVVDQTHERAERLARALDTPSSPIVAEVAAALRRLGGHAPLATARLRGATFRDPSWAHDPLVPLVVSTTVDQLGSRLLFRGYGVSAGARPLNAAIVGNDALIVLDEAHLSHVFESTLRTVERLRAARFREGVGGPFAVVSMSATPSRAADFTLDAVDRDPEGSPTLWRRLSTPKRARCVRVKNRRELPRRMAQLVAERLAAPMERTPCLGVVVHRVQTARDTLEAVEEAIRKARLPADVVLLTGRSRPFERDAVVSAEKGRMLAGRTPTVGGRALVVVATQCIEAGADLDFDALFTECAPLDALRQRLGRLDRLGLRGDAECVIVGLDDELSKAADPVYGDAIATTWRWLSDGGEVQDLCSEALRVRLQETDDAGRVGLTTRRGAAPTLLPGYLDLWAQTRPAPAIEPDPAPFLHGLDRGPGDVQLVWRADLSEDMPPEAVGFALDSHPPTSLEALSLPIHTARAWLARRRRLADVTDVEAAPADEAAANTGEDTLGQRAFWIWRGEEPVVGAPERIRPGDTLVLPATTGGCDRFGWAPESKEPVADLGDAALYAARRWPSVRLDAHVHAPPTGAEWPRFVPDAQSDRWLAPAKDDVAAALAHLAERGGAVGEAARSLLEGGFRSTRSRWRGDTLVVVPETVGGADRRALEVSADRGGDDASRSTAWITLESHGQGVGERAASLVEHLLGGAALGSAVVRAARHHDVGKADPRFQRLLRAMSHDRPRPGTLLAKSDSRRASARTMREAQAQAGYPAGTRHELLSVALLSGWTKLGEESDADLVLHLVGAHHGWCRPYAPVAEPGDAGPTVTVDLEGDRVSTPADHHLTSAGSGVSRRFVTLQRRFGWWGLAFLEGLVRWADFAQSAAESESPGPRPEGGN